MESLLTKDEERIDYISHELQLRSENEHFSVQEKLKLVLMISKTNKTKLFFLQFSCIKENMSGKVI